MDSPDAVHRGEDEAVVSQAAVELLRAHLQEVHGHFHSLGSKQFLRQHGTRAITTEPPGRTDGSLLPQGAQRVNNRGIRFNDECSTSALRAEPSVKLISRPEGRAVSLKGNIMEFLFTVCLLAGCFMAE